MKSRIQKLWRRLHRAPDPIIIRQPGVTWTVQDGNYMRHFWTATAAGHKLRQMIDDAVFTSGLSGHTQDFILGQLAMRQYILGLQSPAPDESPADAEHSTIQEELQP